MDDLELWGGLECTINRVGGAYRDQFAESGHDRRLADLDLVAGLGIRTLRYPVAWERVSPDYPDAADWNWHDPRLERLRALGICVIAGLGSVRIWDFPLMWNVIHALDGPLCTDRRPVGEDGTALFGQADGPRA